MWVQNEDINKMEKQIGLGTIPVQNKFFIEVP